MILCVTLNPCLDKTLTVPPWQPGQMVRGQAVREVVGGKGNNVARALTRLGRSPVRPVTFLGGPVGAHCEHLLRSDDGLEPLITPTDAPTRVILTVRTGDTPEQTSFFDPSPEILPDEADALLNRVEGALTEGGVQALTLSGSSPSPTTHGLYSDLIALARSRQVPVFLDTYGPALESIWGFWPDALQLNRREAALHLEAPRPSDAALLDLLDRLVPPRRRPAPSSPTAPAPSWSSSAAAPTASCRPGSTPSTPSARATASSPGSSMAGSPGLEPEALLLRAVACAVANALVWDAGAIQSDHLRDLEGRIEIEPLR